MDKLQTNDNSWLTYVFPLIEQSGKHHLFVFRWIVAVIFKIIWRKYHPQFSSSFFIM